MTIDSIINADKQLVYVVLHKLTYMTAIHLLHPDRDFTSIAIFHSVRSQHGHITVCEGEPKSYVSGVLHTEGDQRMLY